MYDVTRRDSFEDLEAVWMREVELYSNVEGAVRILVANKVDLVSPNGAVSWLVKMVEGCCSLTCHHRATHVALPLFTRSVTAFT